MRIGIEAQRIFRARKHGMDIVVLEVLRQLQEMDHTNEYVVFANEGPDVGCLKETSNFEIVVFRGSYAIWEQTRLPQMAMKYRCDILHCTSNTSPLSSRVPIIATIHDIIYLEKNPLFQRGYSWYQRLGNLYRNVVVRKSLASVKKIITVSHYEAERFEQVLRIDRSRLEVVYNGVGRHFFIEKSSPTKEVIKQKYSLPERYITFLGNTDPKKNTPRVLEVFAQLCSGNHVPHKLVVADLSRDYALDVLKRKKLEKYIDRIHFTGYIPNEELPYLIGASDLFLYPSLRESFGIPILEAMAAGTPVITSNTASMPEVAGGAAVLVDPTRADALAAAIRELLADEERREELVRKGRERAMGFTWRQTAEQTLALYTRLGAEESKTEEA